MAGFSVHRTIAKAFGLDAATRLTLPGARLQDFTPVTPREFSDIAFSP